MTKKRQGPKRKPNLQKPERVAVFAQAYIAYGGNLSKASAAAGISWPTAKKWLELPELVRLVRAEDDKLRKAAQALTMDRAEWLETMTRLARESAGGVRPYMPGGEIDPASFDSGVVSYDPSRQSIRVRDALPILAEIGKAAGYHHESEGSGRMMVVVCPWREAAPAKSIDAEIRETAPHLPEPPKTPMNQG
jgi:hypothetical protein